MNYSSIRSHLGAKSSLFQAKIRSRTSLYFTVALIKNTECMYDPIQVMSVTQTVINKSEIRPRLMLRKMYWPRVWLYTCWYSRLFTVMANKLPECILFMWGDLTSFFGCCYMLLQSTVAKEKDMTRCCNLLDLLSHNPTHFMSFLWELYYTMWGELSNWREGSFLVWK